METLWLQTDLLSLLIYNQYTATPHIVRQLYRKYIDVIEIAIKKEKLIKLLLLNVQKKDC